MPVITDSRRPSGIPRLETLPDWAIVLAAAVIPCVVGVLLLREPDHVSRVTITNPTSSQIEILASTPDDTKLSLVTIIASGENQDALGFLDRGDAWVLHFRGSGFEVQPVSVRRADFVDLGGPYVIPDSVGQELADLAQPGTPGGG